MNKFLVLFFISFSLSAQIKGVVKDSLSGEPIPYVNIWVENETVGTTSEIDGNFSLGIKEEKVLVFSALGYESKKEVSTNEVIFLKPIAYELNEVVVEQPRFKEEIEIGKTKNNGFHEVYNAGPIIRAKFFPFQEKHNNTKFLKEISILTSSEIDSTSFKIRIFSVGTDGFPDKDLVEDDIFVYVKKGNKKTIIDISKYRLEFSEKGLFIAFETLLIKKNEHEILVQNNKTNNTFTLTNYYPYFKHNFVDRENTFSFYGGGWKKEKKYKYKDGSNDLKIFEPAITLTLTN
jgi:hypothetical protein